MAKLRFNFSYTTDDGTVTPIDAVTCEVPAFDADDLTDRTRFLAKLQAVEGPMAAASKANLEKAMQAVVEKALKETKS